ncbi:hypothetical protein F5B21DRAFT_507014 [Xylaria acuta]|nr:hypothetical protein F5B21DRAFT_507014 [Xylaria acuta]
MEGMRPISDAVDLMSSEGYAKLLARTISTGEAIDPIQLSLNQKLSLTFRWRWPRMTAFAWITLGAANPLFGRGFGMWGHPKLLKERFTRHATEAERDPDFLFRNYPGRLVKQSSSSLSREPDTAKHPESKVLTPVFYSRLVYYAYAFEAMAL